MEDDSDTFGYKCRSAASSRLSSEHPVNFDEMRIAIDTRIQGKWRCKREASVLIEKLRITGHPAVGNVELDFRDDTGEPARTVVIAGENGIGKTVVLEAMHSLFESGSNFPCQVDAELRIDEEEALRIAGTSPPVFAANRRRLYVRRWARSTLMASAEEHFDGNFFGIDNSLSGFALRTFYSEANVLYATSDLQTVTPDALDRRGIEATRASNVQGLQIPQLLLALHYEDLNNYSKYHR